MGSFPGTTGFDSGGKFPNAAAPPPEYPTVVATATAGTPTDITNPTLTLPGGIAGGRWILLAAGTENNPTITVPSGFTELANHQGGSGNWMNISAKIANGTEGGTDVEWTRGSADRTAMCAWVIDGCRNTLTSGVTYEVGTFNSPGGTQPDPDSITTTWASDKNLFIALYCAFNEGALAHPNWPTDYTHAQTETNANGGTVNNDCSMGMAARQLEAQTENPGPFTLDDSEAYIAGVMAIRSAA